MSSARDHIIQTTCQLLELQGYHATGLNEIIRASGSPKGSLYHYFPGGKEELAEEAVRHVGKIVLQRIRDNLAIGTTAADSVREFILNIALNVELSGFRAGGPITTIALETASTNERLRLTCEEIYNDWQRIFAERLIVDGIDEQTARQIAVLCISAIEGGVILCRTQRSRVPLEHVAHSIGTLIECGQR